MKKVLVVLIAAFAVFIITVQAASYEEVLPLQGRVVILDAGHGLGADNIFSGYSEQRRMLFLAREIQAELEARGATVLFTRENEADVLLPVRAALTNKWALQALRDVRVAEMTYSLHPPHLQDEIREIDRLLELIDRIIYDAETYAPIYTNTPFCAYHTVIHPDWQRVLEFQNDPLIRYNFLKISLHSNATPGPVINTNIHGADVFMSTNNNPRVANYFTNYSHVDITYLFSDMLLSGINSAGIQRREIIPHHWFVIRETNVPAVLVENGFHTNSRDRANLMNDAFMTRLAAVYVQTIEEYFSIINESATINIMPINTHMHENAEPINGNGTKKEPTPDPAIAAYISRIINLTSETLMYTNIDDATPVASIAPQPVRVLGIHGEWALINTWLGPKWIMF